ncbi:MAG TPA: universal stress protein [Candidatus Dormibacteraeota bacterium]|nr:universal stress protein [Candidatus Dormibacteraeota bacterium]
MKTQQGPILLATDGSAGADTAAKAASQLARALHTGVHVVHCWMPVINAYGPAGYIPMGAAEAFEAPAAMVLQAEVAALKRLKAAPDGSHLFEGRAAEVVPDLALELGARLIVIGSRGLGAIKRLVLGSVSEGIVHTSHTPVLVVRGARRPWPPSDIIVGDDGSAESRLAASSAASIAQATGAQLRIVHVIAAAWHDAASPGQSRAIAAASAAADATINRIADEVQHAYGFRHTTSVLIGDPAATLVAEARKSALPAMLAVGSRGRGAVRRLAMGSVSTNVLRAAPGSILVYPHPRHDVAALLGVATAAHLAQLAS